MMWLSGGFVFRRTDSIYHRLDPRVKLLISLLLFTLSLLVRAVYELAFVLLVMLSIGAVAKLLRRLSRTMLLTGGFSVFIFVINVVFTHNLATSALYAVRFVAIVVSTSLFFLTASPDELEQVMKMFRLPRDVVFAFVTAVRFIPVMMLDTLQIMDAQKSRGLELEKGNLVRRVRNMVPILIPLVVNSVIRSGELAEAMESRAYGSTPKPTSLYGMRMTWYDRAVAIGSLLLLFVVALYIYHFVSFGV